MITLEGAVIVNPLSVEVLVLDFCKIKVYLIKKLRGSL